MTKPNQIKFRAKLWKYQGKVAWYFFTIPYEESVLIKYHNAFRKKGWGSVPVLVKLGKSEWKTSVFPESKSGCYILPMKVEIRKTNNIKEEDYSDIIMELL